VGKNGGLKKGKNRFERPRTSTKEDERARATFQRTLNQGKIWKKKAVRHGKKAEGSFSPEKEEKTTRSGKYARETQREEICKNKREKFIVSSSKKNTGTRGGYPEKTAK